MTAPADRRSIVRAKQLLDLPKIKATIMRNKLLWVTPTIVFALLGLAHVLTKKSTWKATQTLIVRDEAIGEMGFGNSAPLGRFESTDSLKRFLDTVFQVSKNREVLRAALEQVGPLKGKRRDFPNEKHVEALRDVVSVSAPKGTEFGTSEVIYLSVTATDPDRAVGLASAMCDELDNRMRTIRNEYAQSIITELQEKKSLAESDLELATKELSELEGKIGQDLAEMRMLAEGHGGESNLRTQFNQIKAEMRQAESQQDAERELLVLLEKFSHDSDAILATPNRLLESQPALRRLKDGLVDAQLRTARLRGGLTETHPRVQSALQNEKNVEAQLLGEVSNAVFAINAEISLNDRLMKSLQQKLDALQGRLDVLASERAAYANVAAAVNQRREQVRLTSTSLAEARGRQEAAKTSSLITRVDAPVTGTNPEGPGRLALLVGSSLAGLAIGMSLVYLLAPWQEAQRGRRESDRLRRRQSDQTQQDRRQTPVPSSAPPIAPVSSELGSPVDFPSQSSSLG